MTRPDELLEQHTLVMRDGRILEVLPTAVADERYASRAVLERPAHLLMPGLVNAHTAIGARGGSGSPERGEIPPFVPAAAVTSIGNLLKGGVTSFCAVGYFPRAAAEFAAAQGMRAVIGLPVAEHASPAAETPAEYLTKALRLRDEYKGHPSISTRFAPLGSAALSDETYARLATLSDELDAGLVISVHASQRELDDSLLRYGARPLERLMRFGLVTPALTATHMVHLSETDLELTHRGGVAVALCLASSLMRGEGRAPIRALTDLRVPLGLGSDAASCGNAQDVWSEIKLLGLLSPYEDLGGAKRAVDLHRAAWDALAAATLGGAKALGLEREIGTIETGKWADLCCIDLGDPGIQPVDDPLEALVFGGGRELVSDVWVDGRQLLSKGRFTRLEWPGAAHERAASRLQGG